MWLLDTCPAPPGASPKILVRTAGTSRTKRQPHARFHLHAAAVASSHVLSKYFRWADSDSGSDTHLNDPRGTADEVAHSRAAAAFTRGYRQECGPPSPLSCPSPATRSCSSCDFAAPNDNVTGPYQACHGAAPTLVSRHSTTSRFSLARTSRALNPASAHRLVPTPTLTFNRDSGHSTD